MTPAPGWLRASADEVPPHDGWLAPAERAALAGLRVPSRRRDWRLGRWAAKRAVAAVLGQSPLDAIEVVAAPDGAPEIRLGGLPAPVAVSLTHRSGLAVCLVAGPGTAVGCDLELVEPRPPVFAADWFTRAELSQLEAAPAARRDLVVTLVWSAKESALKALREGLRLDTRDVHVRLGACAGEEGWHPLTVTHAGRPLAGWWRLDGGHALTAVLRPAAGPPVSLTA